MEGTTNAGLPVGVILANEAIYRESGHWPEWKWRDLPNGLPGAKPGGWLKDIHRFAENGVFVVLVRRLKTEWGEVTHLAFRTASNAVDITWREKQRIKDELVGRMRVAVEVFPAHDELVDEANMFHLWVLPSGFQLPFTLADRRKL